MKFNWDPAKNEWLKKERSISFEEIAILLTNGKVWKHAEHPNIQKYPNQYVFFVEMNEYIYFVPYVMDGDTIFLKTAFPHRQATKDYLKERNEDGLL